MKEINKQMLKTMGARIRLIRKSLKESQSDFAKHFDLKHIGFLGRQVLCSLPQFGFQSVL
jgi:hypothetical protein